jgi:hypothetical protein
LAKSAVDHFGEYDFFSAVVQARFSVNSVFGKCLAAAVSAAWIGKRLWRSLSRKSA